MRLSTPFLKLPIQFDAEALAAEVRALPPSAWSPHATGMIGNEAVRLVTRGGQQTDEFHGAMGPTEQLGLCPYTRQIMAEFGSVWGRSRFMGLAAGAEVRRHVDVHYYWRTHWRIHIPVITSPKVLFTCGTETVHMAAGECWLFDSFQFHDVQNGGTERRVHLVLDTVGGGRLPELFRLAQSGRCEPKLLRMGERTDGPLLFEQINSPNVMSPWEMRCHLAFLAERAKPDPLLGPVLLRLERFVDDWAAAWAAYGADDRGRPTYRTLLLTVRDDLGRLGGNHLQLNNDWPLYASLDSLMLQVALARPEPQAPSSKVSASHVAHA